MIGHATFLRPGNVANAMEPAARYAYQAAMEEPSPRSSRLALAGALAAAIVVGGAGFLLGRGTVERPPPVAAPPIVAPAPTPSPEPVSNGVLGRADLIALAATAADAAAAGRDPDPDIAKADGRRFELRLPFGCDGPAGEDSTAAMRWRYDAEDGTLRVHVDPVIWTAQDWVPRDPTGIEAIEGFWIARPWTSGEACPVGGAQPAAIGAEPVTLPGQTLALGQVFLADGPRGGKRDGKPYEVVVRVSESELDTSSGFRLRVSGRIAGSLGAGPVRCRQPAGPEQRPICLVGVVMDEVAIENAASSKTLATWSLGGRDTAEPSPS